MVVARRTNNMAWGPGPKEKFELSSHHSANCRAAAPTMPNMTVQLICVGIGLLLQCAM
jgi:hypothetical protein